MIALRKAGAWALNAAVGVALLVLIGCANSSSQKAAPLPAPADISKFQTVRIHVVEAETGLPLAGVQIRHVGGHLRVKRDVEGLQTIPPMEIVRTDKDGDARLQPLEDGDSIGFELDEVDSQDVVIGYYASGKVRDSSLQLRGLIVRAHALEEVEQSLTLGSQEVAVVPITRSLGGPADPLAQQCLRELHELKRGLPDAKVEQLLHAHGFFQDLPPTQPSTFTAASKSIDTFERRQTYLSKRFPQRELRLIFYEDSDLFDHYHLNEWYIENLDTATRTEDADVLRQARPRY